MKLVWCIGTWNWVSMDHISRNVLRVYVCHANYFFFFYLFLENILLTKKSRSSLLKIVDFGLSKDMNTRLASFVGKLNLSLSFNFKRPKTASLFDWIEINALLTLNRSYYQSFLLLKNGLFSRFFLFSFLKEQWITWLQKSFKVEMVEKVTQRRPICGLWDASCILCSAEPKPSKAKQISSWKQQFCRPSE